MQWKKYNRKICILLILVLSLGLFTPVTIQADTTVASGSAIEEETASLYRVSVKNYDDYHSIKWRASSGTKKVLVERSVNGGAFLVIGEYDKIQRCKVYDVSYYTQYQYRFTALDIYGNKGESVTLSLRMKTLAKSNLSFVKSKVNKIQLTFGKVQGAKGYEIYRSTKKNSGYKMICHFLPEDLETDLMGRCIYQQTVNTKKTYYYKIRSYVMVDEVRKYSEYSDLVKVQGYSKAYLKKQFNAFRKIYRNKWYWNHVGKPDLEDNSEIVTKRPCTSHKKTGKISDSCNDYVCEASKIHGYQCAGFAWKLSDLAFGENIPVKKTKSYAKAKIGDVIRYSGHSVIIIQKTKKYVKVAECNYDGRCRIKWGRKITKKTLKKAGAVYSSRY